MGNMTFLFKFFFIIQISYWLHIFPELYFQKMKKEEMPAKIQYAVLYLAFIGASYVLRFTRLSLVLLVCLLQAWLMWNWIMFQVKRMREAKPSASSSSSSSSASKNRKTEQEKAKARKLRKEQEDRESDLPEVDQDAKKSK